jgi:iron complex outermembrane receptor protein
MRFIIFCLFLLFIHPLYSQTKDSIYYELQQVEVTNVSNETQLRLPSSQSIIGTSQLNQQSPYSFVPAMNTVPGVRMEERSPGSYRLSIRGSLLRSPFGVRNVKIYLSDFPFTDAGGNTYLNNLNIGSVGSLRVLKGPEASIFGANTGGVLLIDPVMKISDSLSVATAVSWGSYGLFNENVSFQKRSKNTLFHFNQSYQHSDGYRENSAMKRFYLQTGGTWDYSKKANLKLLVLFSDLNYQTPGGLTITQYNSNPVMARPSTPTLPGAVEQKAAVMSQTIFGGVSHDVSLSKNVRHVLSIFGSHTDFQNPFITNYERREESTYGARTHLDLSTGKPERISTKWNLGAEWQQTSSLINNYGNNHGAKDTLQASDNINAQQFFLFTRFLTDIGQRLLIEVSASYNFFNYRYRNNYPFGESSYNRKNFTPQFMPRLALSYKITSNVSWRISASSGYSPPTIAEVRSSNNVVNTALQAEKGQNYESGFRIRDNKDYLWIDVSAFHYSLSNAIVRRVDVNGNEYFINAGGTHQPGLEGQASLWILKERQKGFLRSLQIKGNITYNQFTFSHYEAGTVDYSGNKLTGVPKYTTVESISLTLPASFSFFIQYYYSDRIPLNDGTTVYAKQYHLVQLKGEWKKNFAKLTLGIFAGVDNLLNQKYSLGNDLNAAGSRYFNAAPLRNYYAGVKGEF